MKKLMLAACCVALCAVACKRKNVADDSKSAAETTESNLAKDTPAPGDTPKDEKVAAETAAAAGTPSAALVEKIQYLMKTSLGDITIELDSEKAPISVANFQSYAKAGRYNGTIFHRVIDDFMIQGGGFDTTLTKVKTDAPIKNEANNGRKNLKYTLAMARTNVVDSATNQFFINVKDNPFLNNSKKNFGYAVFGEVVAGQEVIDKMKKVATGPKGPFRSDVPVKNVEILKVDPVKASAKPADVAAEKDPTAPNAAKLVSEATDKKDAPEKSNNK